MSYFLMILSTKEITQSSLWYYQLRQSGVTVKAIERSTPLSRSYKTAYKAYHSW